MKERKCCVPLNLTSILCMEALKVGVQRKWPRELKGGQIGRQTVCLAVD